MIPGLIARGLLGRAGVSRGIAWAGGFATNIVSGILGSISQQADTMAQAARALAAVKTLLSGMHIEHNIGAGSQWLNGLEREIRFVTARALTRTAHRVRQRLEREVEHVFDKPTSFTKRAFSVKAARRDGLTSVVEIKPKQASYLMPQIVGGSRGPKRFEQRLAAQTNPPAPFFVPGPGVRLNASGNLTPRAIADVARRINQKGIGRARRFRGGVFAGVPRGHPGAPFGIWGRNAGRLVPLLIQVSRPTYSPRFLFYEVGVSEAERVWPEEFARSWRESFGTAGPRLEIKLDVRA